MPKIFYERQKNWQKLRKMQRIWKHEYGTMYSCLTDNYRTIRDIRSFK